MVRFCSGKTTVQLSITELENGAGTIAETSQNAKQTSNIQERNLEFVNGPQNWILPEVYIKDPEDGMSTHFLGKNKDIPFLMAQAGYNVVSASTPEVWKTWPARIQLEDGDEERRTGAVAYASLDQHRVSTPPSKPQALCLTVFLDPKAFISLEPKDRMTMKDIRIDVYLNGHFFDSELIRHSHATRSSTITKQIVRFTGYRINNLIEKPWILVPSGQDADGTPAQYHDRGNDAPGRRWYAISEALRSAADRAGRKRDGGRTALGECLESLASLPMQPEVAGVQIPGSANFGVVDVVISWAKCRKANLLEAYRSGSFTTIVEGYEDVEPVGSLVDANAKDISSRISNPDIAPRTPTSISAGTDSFDESAKDTTTFYGNAAAYPSPASCAHTPTNSIASTADIGRSTFERFRLAASSSRKRTRSVSILSPASQSRRSKQTLGQEMASIQKEAEQDDGQRKASKVGRQSTPSGARRKNQPINIEESSTEQRLSPESISLVEMGDETDTPGPSQKAKPKLPPSTTKLRPPKNVKPSKGKGKEPSVEIVENPRQRSRTKAVSTGKPHDAGFKVPELSKDCVITYAPPGLVRNVGASRKIYRVEEGAVIVGVRFLVG